MNRHGPMGVPPESVQDTPCLDGATDATALANPDLHARRDVVLSHRLTNDRDTCYNRV